MDTGNKICAFVTCFAVLGLAAIFFIANVVEDRNVLAENAVNSEAPVIKIGNGDEKVQFLGTIQDTPEATNNPTQEPTSEPTSETFESLGIFKITAYCACEKCCGKADGITASGSYVKEGRTIAADTSVLPFGTTVLINGHLYTVEDRGGAVRGNHVDIYMASHQEALEYGVQYHEVFLTQKSK